MTPLIQLNRQLQYLFVALLVACFGIAQSAQAGPDNEVTLQIDKSTPVLDCTPEKVRLGGRVLLRFGVKRHNGEEVVFPEHIQLLDVRGRGLSTDRLYEPGANETILRPHHFEVILREGEHSSALFTFQFAMIGRPNPPGKADPNPEKIFDFVVHYAVVYKFNLAQRRNFGLLRGFQAGEPKFNCSRDRSH